MPSLPLLELAYLSSQQVLQEMNPMELYELSFLSKRCLWTIRNAKLKVKLLDFNYSNQFPVIRISPLGSRSATTNWEFGYREENGNLKERTIGLHSIREFPSNTPNTLRLHHDNPQFGALILFQYLCSLYQGPISLNLCLHVIPNVFSLLIHPEFQKCDKLKITSYKESPAEIEGILEVVEVEKELEMMLVDAVRVEKALELDVINIYSASWMTLADLLNLGCREVTLGDHKFFSRDVRKFVENWMAGGCPRMERLQLKWQFDWKLDLEGLGAKPWNVERRNQHYCMTSPSGFKEYMDCSRGRDFVRPDGRTATVIFEEFFEPALYFLVWTDEQLASLNCYEEI